MKEDNMTMTYDPKTEIVTEGKAKYILVEPPTLVLDDDRTRYDYRAKAVRIDCVLHSSCMIYWTINKAEDWKRPTGFALVNGGVNEWLVRKMLDSLELKKLKGEIE
jgi:hypothetical protein